MYYQDQDGDGDGDMEAGLDRLLPAVIEALAPVAASIHTLKLSNSSHQLGAAMSASLLRTLPSLRELHVSYCRLHDSVVASLAHLRKLRLLRLEAPLCADEANWGRLVATFAALLADGGPVREGGGGEGRLRLEWEEPLLTGVERLLVNRLQDVVEAVSAAGVDALFTHNQEQLRGAYS